MGAAFRWIAYIASFAALAGMNIVLVGILPLLPSGTVILSAGGVLATTLLLILPHRLVRLIRERAWGRAIVLMIIWLPPLAWNWLAAAVAIDLGAKWGGQAATTTQLLQTPPNTLYDGLVALMGLVVVLAASLMPNVWDGERSGHGPVLKSAGADELPAGGRADYPVWSDEVAVHSSEQRSDPHPDPPPRNPHSQAASSARRPGGAAVEEVIRILLALPEQRSDGIHKLGCHIDCTQSALARETGFSKSTVNAAIHKLHREGRLSVQTWARCTRITLRSHPMAQGELLEAA